MARQAFFSFHYQNDIWRVNQVRNSGLTRAGLRTDNEWFDHSLWEKAKSQGKQALVNLIEGGLKGASVTVVLIGNETSKRPWVRYEIERSWQLGMGLLGVYVERLEDLRGRAAVRGENPFTSIVMKDRRGRSINLGAEIPCYDYVGGDGYKKLGMWIEDAARRAGR